MAGHRRRFGGWKRCLEHLCRAADLKRNGKKLRAHAYMLRRTFAIEKLNAGASLEDVLLLLAHHTASSLDSLSLAREKMLDARPRVRSLPNARLMQATKKPPKGGVTRRFDAS